jgi:aspartate/tyrosine/aromatic aminotransferase
MFESVSLAPADPILGLSEAFQQDVRPQKINLSVGVYQDASGKTPILESVKRAERLIWENETTKGYLKIDGAAEYGLRIQELLFGADSPIVAEGRAVTSQTPGGTGALRVAGDFIHRHFPQAKLWLSAPTWPNHPNIFHAAGIETVSYPYFDKANNRLAWDDLCDALNRVSAGDVVLLHGCCHNPTGIDPTPDQWKTIAAILRERGALPLIDFAYQGFATGLREDAAVLEAFCAPGTETLVCSSLSKNFGLYRERVGALTLVAAAQADVVKAQSQVKSAIRANYSNPPSHGGAVATTILGQSELRGLWEEELTAMRNRIHQMRSLLVAGLKQQGVRQDFSFIADQKGMFSFSGLNPEQVQKLRDDYAIYIVGSGRINVAGMTTANMEPLCAAIAAVL